MSFNSIRQHFVLCIGVLALAPIASGQDVYVSNFDPDYGEYGSVTHYNSTGQYLGSLSAPGKDLDGGIAFDATGNLYVASSNSYQTYDVIRKFSPTGQDLGNFATSANGISSPRGIAFDADYNLYVSNFSRHGGYVEKYSSTGTDLGVLITGPADPDGIVYHNGVLYIADQGSSKISEYATDGTYLGGFYTLNGRNGKIAIGPDGNLYTVPIYSGAVEKYSLSGQFLGVVATNPNFPIGVAVDPSGTVYEYGGIVQSSVNTDEIHKYSATGVDLGIFTTQGLNTPQFIAFAVPEPDLRLGGALAIMAIGFLARRRNRPQK